MENSDSNSELQSHKTAAKRNVGGSNFNFPSFLAGFRKGLSSLDSNEIPSLRSPPSLKWTRTPLYWRRWTWECDKVGLNIINSPNDLKEAGGALDLRKQTSILFGSQVKRNSVSAKNANRIFVETLTGKYFPYRNYIVSPPFRKIADICNVSGSNFLSGTEGISQLLHFVNLGLLNNEVPSSSQTRIPPNTDRISQNGFSMLRNVNINHGAFSGGKALVENSLGIQQKLDPIPITSSQAQTGTISITEENHDEDYTCITFHGPNPMTKYFGGYPFVSNINNMAKCGRKIECKFELAHLEDITSLRENFLHRCYICNKQLYGEDIYMYRDECFCSPECREEEVNADDSGENARKRSFSESSHSSSQDDIFIKRRSIAK